MQRSTPDFPNPVRGTRGMVVAPHALASQAALAVLRDGGNAVEAMVAAAAAIAVVYPHMNGLGGDSFWLIAKAGAEPVALDACGAAVQAATRERYLDQGLERIPFRGPLAANTVAGTVSGWEQALHWSREQLGGRLPLTRLLEDAIGYARDGVPVTRSQSLCTASRLQELQGIPGFARTFLAEGAAPAVGQRFCQPQLAATLQQLAQAGLGDFYRGAVADAIAADFAAIDGLVTRADLERHQARWRTPLRLAHSHGEVFNLAPPTQGLVSLLILGLLDRLLPAGIDPLGPDYVHLAVEATKRAFAVRDRVITDPARLKEDPQSFLAPGALDAMAAGIDREHALPWGQGRGPGDTVWMGVIDAQGNAVSFIQSIYHEFGSGVVLAGSGLNWQNRGCSFSLQPDALNPLEPGRLPFHTLNPALARLSDGRTLVYGNMGGDGQPQSQSAVFTRIVHCGHNPQAAISAPRWLLGRTWGQSSDSLKLESRFPDETFEVLRARGHDVERLAAYDETMGHAGALLRGADGLLEGGGDPRSDGGVAAW